MREQERDCFLRIPFLGEVMSQFGVEANLCVRSGEFMVFLTTASLVLARTAVRVSVTTTCFIPTDAKIITNDSSVSVGK